MNAISLRYEFTRFTIVDPTHRHLEISDMFKLSAIATFTSFSSPPPAVCCGSRKRVDKT